MYIYYQSLVWCWYIFVHTLHETLYLHIICVSFMRFCRNTSEYTRMIILQIWTSICIVSKSSSSLSKYWMCVSWLSGYLVFDIYDWICIKIYTGFEFGRRCCINNNLRMGCSQFIILIPKCVPLLEQDMSECVQIIYIQFIMIHK